MTTRFIGNSRNLVSLISDMGLFGPKILILPLECLKVASALLVLTRYGTVSKIGPLFMMRFSFVALSFKIRCQSIIMTKKGWPTIVGKISNRVVLTRQPSLLSCWCIAVKLGTRTPARSGEVSCQSTGAKQWSLTQETGEVCRHHSRWSNIWKTQTLQMVQGCCESN